MAENTSMNNIPKGPWLSEEEIKAILSTDDGGEFDRIMEQRQHRSTRTVWLRSACIAAAVAAILFGAWILINKDVEGGIENTKPVIVETNKATVKPQPEPTAAKETILVETRTKPVKTKRRQRRVVEEEATQTDEKAEAIEQTGPTTEQMMEMMEDSHKESAFAMHERNMREIRQLGEGVQNAVMEIHRIAQASLASR